MISIKDQVAEFLTRVSSFRRNLDDVVEDDECMALMAVSKLKENPELYRYVPFASDIATKANRCSENSKHRIRHQRFITGDI
jgi:hypothetical protein